MKLLTYTLHPNSPFYPSDDPFNKDNPDAVRLVHINPASILLAQVSPFTLPDGEYAAMLILPGVAALVVNAQIEDVLASWQLALTTPGTSTMPLAYTTALRAGGYNGLPVRPFFDKHALADQYVSDLLALDSNLSGVALFEKRQEFLRKFELAVNEPRHVTPETHGLSVEDLLSGQYAGRFSRPFDVDAEPRNGSETAQEGSADTTADSGTVADSASGTDRQE